MCEKDALNQNMLEHEAIFKNQNLELRSARACVTKLHQKNLSGGTVWARQLGGEGSKLQKWKLIIRNLPFKENINEIKEMFSKDGEVHEEEIEKMSVLSRSSLDSTSITISSIGKCCDRGFC